MVPSLQETKLHIHQDDWCLDSGVQVQSWSVQERSLLWVEETRKCSMEGEDPRMDRMWMWQEDGEHYQTDRTSLANMWLPECSEYTEADAAENLGWGEIN